MKIGEGKELPPEPKTEQYQRQLQQNADKFINALQSYEVADSKDKERLRGVMDESMGMIRSAVSEIKRSGAHKQEVKVESDYQAYLKDGSEETRSALVQDLSTLKEYGKS